MNEKTEYEIAIDRIEEAARTGATHLDLRGLGLADVPGNLFYDPEILRSPTKIEHSVQLASSMRRLQVLLCYNANDVNSAANLEEKLISEEWLDINMLQIGSISDSKEKDDFEKTIWKNDIVILCISNNNNQNEEGPLELEVLRNASNLIPDENIFIIPVRVQDCETPYWLRYIHYIDFFLEDKISWAHQQLLESLKHQARKLGILKTSKSKIEPPLKVFLCYANTDRSAVRAIYQELAKEGWMDIWFDEYSLLPGMWWKNEIEKAISDSHLIFVFLSKHSTDKIGYYVYETKLASERAFELPDGTIFIIPARLDECEIPARFDKWQWVDFFSSNGYEKIKMSTKIRAQQVVPQRFRQRKFDLTSIDLSFNELRYIPSELKRLTLLTNIQFEGNKLEKISREIKFPPNLMDLNLKNNHIGIISKDNIKSFSTIENLYLGNNEIAELPPEIGWLSNLRKLDLSKNKLSTLPPEFGNLQGLLSLDISGNNFQKPQFILKNLTSLEYLDIRENPLSAVSEILEKVSEPKTVLNYLVDLWAGQKRFLSETKMLVVGQGSVGKSSLINRLTKNRFSDHQSKTDGIAIEKWQVANWQQGENQPQHIKVNIWDFGGQEIMHATHQFFLTRRSLYLLVLDARISQEENRVEYWLKIIESFGGDSPILIVGNKIDQHPLDIDGPGLRKKYPNIAGIIETSAATSHGLDKLELAITEQINALPHIRDLLPEVWFNVKNQLELLGRGQNFISKEKYSEICKEGNVHEETSQRTLIGFLHDLGVVIHFQDDPYLESLGILNPQWVTNGVYKILNARPILDNNGEMTTKMLSEILDASEYPSDKRLFIVEMMKKFELCYEIDREKYLIPDLLPKSEPYVGEKEWDNALAFQYYYNVFLSSIITRFIVRLNAYVHKTIWRSGVVLKKDGNTALVKADSEDRKVFIWVSGDEHTRRDFLSAIRTEFDAIHKSIIKIEVVQKVPHPDYPNLVLDYAELLQFERDRIKEFPRSIEGKTIIVDVYQLLNGIRISDNSSPNVKDGPKQEIKVVIPETQSIKPTEALTSKKPISLQILKAAFIGLPRIIGRFVLDIFARGKDSAESTFVVLGYILFILAGLVIWGIIDLTSLQDWFTGWFRFFYPVK